MNNLCVFCTFFTFAQKSSLKQAEISHKARSSYSIKMMPVACKIMHDLCIFIVLFKNIFWTNIIFLHRLFSDIRFFFLKVFFDQTSKILSKMFLLKYFLTRKCFTQLFFSRKSRWSKSIDRLTKLSRQI